MIEDKALGLKIAEDKNEKFWLDLKERVGNEIENCYRTIEMDKHLLILVEKNLENYKKEETIPTGVG